MLETNPTASMPRFSDFVAKRLQRDGGGEPPVVTFFGASAVQVCVPEGTYLGEMQVPVIGGGQACGGSVAGPLDGAANDSLVGLLLAGGSKISSSASSGAAPEEPPLVGETEIFYPVSDVVEERPLLVGETEISYSVSDVVEEGLPLVGETEISYSVSDVVEVVSYPGAPLGLLDVGETDCSYWEEEPLLIFPSVEGPTTFLDWVKRVDASGLRPPPSPVIAFDDWVTGQLLKLRYRAPQIAATWNWLLPPAEEGYEWVRVMPWAEYEKEREKEERRREMEKKKAWERYLGMLCDRKRKEMENGGKEEEKGKGTGLVIPMRKEVLQTRFRALFKEGSLERLKEEEKEEEEALRCKKAAELTRQNQFRRLPFTQDEINLRMQRAHEIAKYLMEVLPMRKEVRFPGQVVPQVLKGKVCSEPNSIKILHRTPAGLGVFWVGVGVSLNGWYGDTFGELGVNFGGGYWATKGGRVLSGDAPVGRLGVDEHSEVVLQLRLKGGSGLGGNNNINRNKFNGGEGFFPGDWQCCNCGRQGCWATKQICYRCGAPRVQGGNGNSPQGGFSGGVRGGQQQGGVSTGMGSMREVSYPGRNQQFLGGGGQKRRGGGNKVEAGGGKGVPGAGVGSFGASIWLGEGGNGGLGGVGGGGGGQAPHPVGLVANERERATMALGVLKEILGEDMGNLEERVFGKLPLAKAPTPPASPTEQQRAERYVNLLRQHDRLVKGVGEGKVRLDKAKAEVAKEEERLKRKVGQERAGGVGDWDNISYESLVKVLSKLSEHDKINCMREAGLSFEAMATEGGGLVSEFDGEDEFSPRLAPPAQEDADKTPCG